MLSELNKLFKLIWQKKKMLWLLIMKIFFFTVSLIISSSRKWQFLVGK